MTILDQDHAVVRRGVCSWQWRCTVRHSDWRSTTSESSNGWATSKKSALRKINSWRFVRGWDPVAIEDLEDGGSA